MSRSWRRSFATRTSATTAKVVESTATRATSRDR
jgi:hypothetical protein